MKKSYCKDLSKESLDDLQTNDQKTTLVQVSNSILSEETKLQLGYSILYQDIPVGLESISY